MHDRLVLEKGLSPVYFALQSILIRAADAGRKKKKEYEKDRSLVALESCSLPATKR